MDTALTGAVGSTGIRSVYVSVPPKGSCVNTMSISRYSVAIQARETEKRKVENRSMVAIAVQTTSILRDEYASLFSISDGRVRVLDRGCFEVEVLATDLGSGEARAFILYSKSRAHTSSDDPTLDYLGHALQFSTSPITFPQPLRDGFREPRAVC